MDIQAGDIFIIDDDSFGANTVKFLQTAPTVWHHIWRGITRTQEKVLYYHAGIFLNELTTVEQQWKCQVMDGQRILKSTKRCLVFRFKGVTESNIPPFAIDDIGKPYGILHCIGKTITWLTGIKWFCRYVKEPNGEICINRVCKWVNQAYYFTFGEKTYTELTTHIVYKYIKAHPEMFEIIYTNEVDEYGIA